MNIMTERKSLSKKIRFEIFKRDSFTCQYCGRKAPEVILEIDHLHPVKENGSNDTLNLITSCFECNRGKGKTKISDNSVVEKQRRQIEELNLRRQQLKMLLEWRDGLRDLNDTVNQNAIDYFNSLFEDITLSEQGERELKKLVKKYGLIEVKDTIDNVIEKHFNDGPEVCFKKIGAFLNFNNMPEHKKKIAYIKGIIRNKFMYVNEKIAAIELNKYYDEGFCLDDLKDRLLTGQFKNWSQFRNFIQNDSL